MIYNSTTAYKITSIVLQKENVFTFEEIKNNLLEEKFDCSDEYLRHRLNKLRDIGIIYEQGSYYQLFDLK